MKKTLLAIASLFVAFSSVSAQTPTAVDPVAGQDYYIYCPGSGKYLCPNEGTIYMQETAPVVAWRYTDNNGLCITVDGNTSNLWITYYGDMGGEKGAYNVNMSNSVPYYYHYADVTATKQKDGTYMLGGGGLTLEGDYGSHYGNSSSAAYTSFIFVEANPVYTRDMSYEWGTVVLPFAIDYTAEKVNCKLFKLSGVTIVGNDGTMSFTECASGETIPAGTPLAVKTSGSAISIAYSEPSSIVSEVKSYTVDGYTMNGAFYEKDNQRGIYFIAENQFWYAEAAITVPANRAYISGAANGASFRINEADDTEGIATISNEAQQNGKQMVNGRLMIVKNGMCFNANGQIVK